MKKIHFEGVSIDVSESFYEKVYKEALEESPTIRIATVLKKTVQEPLIYNCPIDYKEAERCYLVRIPLPCANTGWTIQAFRAVEALLKEFPRSYPVHGGQYMPNAERTIGVRVYV
jgi:hypothetical protein